MISQPKTIIDIRDVVKTFQVGEIEVHALRGVDVAIEEGSFLAIMGPSGSGKSTLLNILGCLDRPTSGYYYLGGKNVAQMDDDTLSSIRGKRLGFIFQSYNLIAQLTVIENIKVPLIYQGVNLQDYEQKCIELAAMVGLEDRLEHRPSQLSGGQQQRVAIARSLINDPLMILADEPTGNLDSKTGKEVLELIEKLHRQGKTIVMVTHDYEIAYRADRVIHMMDGRIDSDEIRK